MGRAEMRALIRPVRALMRISRPSAPLGVTHTEPAPTAMFHGSTGKRVGFPTTRFDLGSMRQTAGRGWRVSAHTHPSPAATEKAGAGRRIRATIAPSFSGGADAVLVEFGGFDEVLVESGGFDDVVVQPDATTATPTAMAAASLTEIGAPTRSTRIPLLLPASLVGSGGRSGPAGRVESDRP